MINIVVPSFNEANNVALVVHDIATAFEDIPNKRVIVVDDGSTDETAAVVESLLQQYRFLELVRHPHNLGLGAALKTGYSLTSGGLAAWLPADGQFEARWLRDFLRTWEISRAPIVVGNVTASNRKASDGLLRLALSKALRVLFFLRKKRSINFNGLMLFEIARVPVERFQATTGVINFEILEHFEDAGTPVEFVNISVRPRMSGSSKVTNVRTYVATLRDMLLR